VWFIKFKGFNDSSYPGGTGKGTNGSFHVPTCDWYGTAASPAKCSGFYHDQEQTPEHSGAGRAYKVDGECVEQCDCGKVNPCAEYIFDHRGGVVEGRNFTEWFVNEYMVTNETLYHKNPETGKPQVIGLGWLDDSMRKNGPTEEDRNYIADTGASPQEMQEQVAAYEASMLALKKKVVPMGGYWWQLMGGSPTSLANSRTPVSPTQCAKQLKNVCVAKPGAWNKLTMSNIPGGGKGLKEDKLLDYTAEFMLTRGPYAMLGYSWYGCTGSANAKGGASPDPPRAKEWDMDFGGAPTAACAETGANTGVFSREYPKATVEWDCAAGHGSIKWK